jgi:hypothetical protein
VLASGMSNPFRYFNGSPEVIRLVVMMYVRYPLSLRNVENLLAERGVDISPRDRPILAEPFWPNVCCRDSEATRRPYARLPAVALAFGRGVREDQRQAQLSVARCRS